MALIEFVDQFYGVSLPPDCPKLTAWYRRMRQRPSTQAPTYPEDLLVVARGLPEQTEAFIWYNCMGA
jgi:glutathione S-transferase